MHPCRYAAVPSPISSLITRFTARFVRRHNGHRITTTAGRLIGISTRALLNDEDSKVLSGGSGSGGGGGAGNGLGDNFVMPQYKKSEVFEVTQRTEEVFIDILKLNPDDIPVIGMVLMHKLGITNEEMMIELDRRNGCTGGEAESQICGGDKAEESAKVERTVFDLKLTGFDAKSKIKVIKEVRAVTSLGLKEAKELVEGVPRILEKGIKKEDAEALKVSLEKVGATVEIV